MYVHVQHIGQANQKTMLSTPSMSMLLQGGFTVCTPEKFLKITRQSEIESEGISNILLYSYWSNSYINYTHISYSYLFIYNYFNQRCYTVLHLLTRTIDCIDSVTGYGVYTIYAQATH